MRANGRLPLQEAERHLTEALDHCRSINMVDREADILLDLARVRREQGGGGVEVSATPRVLNDEPLRLAEEALAIAERSGYVLQGADVRLFLAQLALDARQTGPRGPGASAPGPPARRLRRPAGLYVQGGV